MITVALSVCDLTVASENDGRPPRGVDRVTRPSESVATRKTWVLVVLILAQSPIPSGQIGNPKLNTVRTDDVRSDQCCYELLFIVKIASQSHKVAWSRTPHFDWQILKYSHAITAHVTIDLHEVLR